MLLQEYLKTLGMSETAAAEIAEAYAAVPDIGEWLTARGYASDATRLMIRDWQEKFGTGAPTGCVEVTEAVGVRSSCVYKVAAMDQVGGRCYCVATCPVTFPGPMEGTSADGLPPERLAILAAESNAQGIFKWVTLTPSAKLVFGTLLMDGEVGIGRWVWIREYDLARGEKPPGTPVAPGQDIVM